MNEMDCTNKMNAPQEVTDNAAPCADLTDDLRWILDHVQEDLDCQPASEWEGQMQGRIDRLRLGMPEWKDLPDSEGQYLIRHRRLNCFDRTSVFKAADESLWCGVDDGCGPVRCFTDDYRFYGPIPQDPSVGGGR